jgi:hypothetical protein
MSYVNYTEFLDNFNIKEKILIQAVVNKLCLIFNATEHDIFARFLCVADFEGFLEENEDLIWDNFNYIKFLTKIDHNLYIKV